ncbi:MAG: hypothetical protein M1813_009011 [Trichoglossum hirsutum]|nr:MAG: hypothetical protein M1813_009011 [Trichoglossum hirsutum]
MVTHIGIRVLKEPACVAADAVVDIVFVHGLTGNGETTWTEKESEVCWPQQLLPQDIPKARIITFGYDGDITKFWASTSRNSIGNHAQNLVALLANLRERTETALLASKNSAEQHMQKILDCTRAIAFLGTPHCGSDLETWASVFGNFTSLILETNETIVGVLEAHSEVLARIQQEFHTMVRARADTGKPRLNITCFYEELAVPAVGMIVPKHSAILPSYTSIGIWSNHLDMTKFRGSEAPGYVIVSMELWRWTKALESAPIPAPVQSHASSAGEASQRRTTPPQAGTLNPSNQRSQGPITASGQQATQGGVTTGGTQTVVETATAPQNSIPDPVAGTPTNATTAGFLGTGQRIARGVGAINAAIAASTAIGPKTARVAQERSVMNVRLPYIPSEHEYFGFADIS